VNDGIHPQLKAAYFIEVHRFQSQNIDDLSRGHQNLKILMPTIEYQNLTSNPQTPKPFDSHLSTHPELNRIALKLKLDAEYCLWLILRHALTRDGLSGRFTRAQAYDYSKQAGLSFTRKHWNRLIESGNGIFWGRDKKYIFIRSFERVYKVLADDDCISVYNPLFIAIEVKKSGLERKAELYWSWFMSRSEQQIARATITDLFGLSADQQRAYEAHLGPRLIIQTNYAHVDFDLYKNQYKNIPTYAYSFIQERFNEVDNKLETINVIAYQLPNTFIARPKHSAVSAIAKAAKKAINAVVRLYRHALACGKEWRYLRLYYRFYDEWEKKGMPEDAFIRTYYQGKKHIYRSGHFL